MLIVLAEGEASIGNDIKLLQRHWDRQNKINNPNNFNDDGTVKKGRKYWYFSKEMIKTDNKIKTLYQKRSNQLNNPIRY